MRILLTVCAVFAGLALMSQQADARKLPSLSERYKMADDFMPSKITPLVTDLDMQARFVGGDKVLFRRGQVGQGRILLADPTIAAETELTSEPVLASLLVAAGADVKDPLIIRLLDYDTDTQVLKFTALGAEWKLENAGTKVSRIPKEDKVSKGVASPDGRYEVVSRNYNLWLIDREGGREIPLTHDGNFDARYGINYPLMGDMAEANTDMPPLPVAVSWSPDSRHIVTYRMSRNGAFIWTTVQHNPKGSQFPRAFSTVYPNAGAAQVPLIQPVLIDIDTALKDGRGTVRETDAPANVLLWPGNPGLYFEGERILYDWTERGYGQIGLYEIDPATGKATLRVREALKPIVTVTSSFIRNASEWGGYFNVSERSGWAQLYFIPNGSDPSGGIALTKGEWEVTGIERAAEGEPAYITGVGREKDNNPYFRHLYAVTKGGQITHLTPEPLDHHVSLSRDGKWFIDRMSSPTVPTRTVIRSVQDGCIVMQLGQADPAALLAKGFTPPEPFEVRSEDGSVMLYGMIYRPAHFDRSRKYPVIENVYTGPTTHRFNETYGANIGSSVNSLTQLGFIVVTVDGRGTSQRGQAFRLPAYQNLGEVGIDDHIWVLKAMAKKYPYMDLSRVGVFGGSAGGYDAARFILRRPEFYKVAVASSGNHDQRLDKAWWPEVSMGLADDATWEKVSNVNVAGNLRGHLMLIHGDLDDNVPITASLRLSDALFAAGRPHEMVILPNTKHNVTTHPYYLKALRGFFIKHLLGETPPAE